MKATDEFKKVVQQYLNDYAAKDPLFAVALQKPGKNIDDCVTYILNWVKASGCAGFPDDEIFGQAIHYYDEDVIDIGKPVTNVQVVVNQPVELSAGDIEHAKKAALDKVVNEEIAKLRTKRSKKTEVAAEEQTTLF